MAVPWRQNSFFYRKYVYNFLLLYKNRSDIRMFLEVVLSLSTVCIFGIFAIRPTLLTIANLVTEIDNKKKVSSLMDTKISNLSRAQQNLSRNESLVELLSQSVPDGPEPQTYVRQVEALVARHSLGLTQFSVEKVNLKGQQTTEQQQINSDEQTNSTLPPNAKTVDIAVTVSGTYENLKSFLQDLEKTRRMLVVDSFTMSLPRSSQNQQVSLTVTGRILYAQN